MKHLDEQGNEVTYTTLIPKQILETTDHFDSNGQFILLNPDKENWLEDKMWTPCVATIRKLSKNTFVIIFTDITEKYHNRNGIALYRGILK